MARSTYGATPWGAWFVEAIEGFDENGRLARGKSYANTGKVTNLVVREEGPDAKSARGATARIAVVARVKGHSQPWYQVRVEFTRLPEAMAERIYAIIEAEPLLLARIEAGELPAELLDRLKDQGIDLMPRDWNEMKRACNCPDWGDPCKHMAAVYYMLAREIDHDPAMLFRLRGLDLAKRFKRRKPAIPALPFPWKLAPATPSSATPPAAPAPPSIASYTGYVSALLPRRPTFCEDDFAVALVEFYHRSARESLELPAGLDPHAERSMADADYRLDIEGLKVPTDFPLGPGRRPVLVVVRDGREAGRLGMVEAGRLFLGCSRDEGSPGYRFLFHAFRAAHAIVSANAFGPVPLVQGTDLSMLWRPLPSAKDAVRALGDLARLDPGLYSKAKAGSVMVADGDSLVAAFAAAYAGDWVRSLGFRPPGEKAAMRPFVDLFFAGGLMDVSGPGRRGLAGAIDAWLSILSLDFAAWRYRFSVGSPDAATPADRAARYVLGVTVAPGDGDTAHKPGPRRRAVALKDAAKAYGTIEPLKPAAALSAWLPELRELSLKKSVELDEPRLAGFLGEAAGLLSRLGAEVVLPRELHRALKPRLAMSATVKGGGSLRSYLDLDSILEYDWKIALGDEVLDLKAFEALMKSGRDIVAFKDGYVLVDPAEAARLLSEARGHRKPTALRLLAASLSGEAVFSSDAAELVESLLRDRDFGIPAGLTATLRPYQERGFRWACSNLSKGFGCVLADDMGLGKTVQAIGVMLRLAEDGQLDGGALVVAPAALLVNWERELARFAPSLEVARYHGPKRRLPAGSRVVLTTYQTAVRDAEKLKDRPFALLVANEAHLLKNAATRQSRVVKELPAVRKLALSGTPVENRLEDLRSLFDLVIPGYLGGPDEFRRAWRVPIELERNADVAERLRKITAPFLMRRLKTDKAIIADLPDKVVVDEYAVLTPGQAALYESVVRSGLSEAAAAAERGDATGRRALVLKLITALKQICDHPALYDGESPPEAALSGKCGVLLALLDEILERREKVIVFSQYVGALRILAEVMGKELGERPLLYHGGMGQKLRGEAVDAFQTDPSRRIFLVSLKAGGLGLNLTAASRVIHYDLWFNPAVENQATDRAFRIGQTRNVFVHRIITTGTFEEKIDAMLRSKRELADMSVASGETWLSRLDDAELAELFRA